MQVAFATLGVAGSPVQAPAAASDTPSGQEQDPASVTEAATAVMSAEMDAHEGWHTAQQLAEAERTAGILFDAAHVEAAASAAREQARTEYEVELKERGKQLAHMAGAKRQRDAVLRLCEGRRGEDLLLVAAVTAAAECGTTALDGLPMTLAWTSQVVLPDGGRRDDRAVVECSSAYGGRADLVLTGDERQALASLLDAGIVPDIHAPCPNSTACGLSDEEIDADDPMVLGWARLDVAGIEGAPRWYCTPMCVSNALARAGAELAEADNQAELDGGL